LHTRTAGIGSSRSAGPARLAGERERSQAGAGLKDFADDVLLDHRFLGHGSEVKGNGFVESMGSKRQGSVIGLWGFVLLLAAAAGGGLGIYSLLASSSSYTPPLPADSGGEVRGPSTQAIVRLGGPNDGEPVNGRYLQLMLLTNISRQAALTLHAGGALVLARPLSTQSGSDFVIDEATGLNRFSIVVDPQSIQALLGSASNSQITFIATLYGEPGGELLGAGSWCGRLPCPWIEVSIPRLEGSSLEPLAAASGDSVLLAKPANESITVKLHPRRDDAYHLLLASDAPEWLSRWPHEALSQQKAIVLSRGAISDGQLPPATLQTSVLPPAWRGRTVIVLWTYHPAGGWTRSGISPLQ
jgi:hypothetical protein